jgi:hypothetical protein
LKINEISNLISRKENRLNLHESKVLRKIFVPKREEVKRGW